MDAVQLIDQQKRGRRLPARCVLQGRPSLQNLSGLHALAIRLVFLY